MGRFRGVNSGRYGILNNQHLTVSRPHLLTPPEVRVAEEAEREARAKKKPRRLRVSKGHVRNVQKKMRSIRKSKEKGRPPSRRIPRKSLETVIALDLK